MTIFRLISLNRSTNSYLFSIWTRSQFVFLYFPGILCFTVWLFDELQCTTVLFVQWVKVYEARIIIQTMISWFIFSFISLLHDVYRHFRCNRPTTVHRQRWWNGGKIEKREEKNWTTTKKRVWIEFDPCDAAITATTRLNQCNEDTTTERYRFVIFFLWLPLSLRTTAFDECARRWKWWRTIPYHTTPCHTISVPYRTVCTM